MTDKAYYLRSLAAVINEATSAAHPLFYTSVYNWTVIVRFLWSSWFGNFKRLSVIENDRRRSRKYRVSDNSQPNHCLLPYPILLITILILQRVATVCTLLPYISIIYDYWIHPFLFMSSFTKSFHTLFGQLLSLYPSNFMLIILCRNYTLKLNLGDQ